jgi:dCTP deaminase
LGRARPALPAVSLQVRGRRRLAGLPERTVLHRVGLLWQAGLLNRVRPPREVDTSPYHCWLTPLGAEAIGGPAPEPFGKDLPATLATRCGDAYRKAGDRTRRLFNAAVFTRLEVQDGRLCHEEYRPPFDDIFNVSGFEYGTRERATGIEPAFSAWEADVLPLNYARTPPGRARRALWRRLDTDVAESHYRLARMVLSDHSIREALDAGRIVIDPLGEGSIQPSSVDLHVDRYFRLFRNHTSRVIDVREDQEDLTELVEMGEDVPLILHPGEFLLGSTLEKVTLPADLVARLEGKSSLGRLGLLIHSTAGFVDAGWDGHLTLELSNVANLPITVYPGMKIGQISFLEMTTPADHPYGSDGLRSKYQGQWGPTPSRYADNFRP